MSAHTQPIDDAAMQGGVAIAVARERVNELTAAIAAMKRVKVQEPTPDPSRDKEKPVIRQQPISDIRQPVTPTQRQTEASPNTNERPSSSTQVRSDSAFAVKGTNAGSQQADEQPLFDLHANEDSAGYLRFLSAEKSDANKKTEAQAVHPAIKTDKKTASADNSAELDELLAEVRGRINEAARPGDVIKSQASHYL